MNIDKIKQAKDLHEQGFSLRQIAQKMGVGKTTVHSWLKEIDLVNAENNVPPTAPNFAPNDGQNYGQNGVQNRPRTGKTAQNTGNYAINSLQGYPLTDAQIELEKHKLTLEYNLKSEAAAQQLELGKLEVKRGKIALQQKKLDAEKEAKAKAEAKEKAKIEKQGKKLYGEYVDLLNSFKDQVNEGSWNKSEWDEFEESCETLKEKITDFLDEHVYWSLERSIILQGLNFLIDVAGETVKPFFGGVIDLELDEEQTETLDYFLDDETDEEGIMSKDGEDDDPDKEFDEDLDEDFDEDDDDEDDEDED